MRDLPGRTGRAGSPARPRRHCTSVTWRSSASRCWRRRPCGRSSPAPSARRSSPPGCRRNTGIRARASSMTPPTGSKSTGPTFPARWAVQWAGHRGTASSPYRCSCWSTIATRSCGRTCTTTRPAGCRGCGGATWRRVTGRRCRTRTRSPRRWPNSSITFAARPRTDRCCEQRRAGRGKSSGTCSSWSPAPAAESAARPRGPSLPTVPRWWSAISTRPDSSRRSRKSPDSAPGRTPICSTSPMPKRCSASPIRCALTTACPTSWSTTPASAWPARSSTPRANSSTACST